MSKDDKKILEEILKHMIDMDLRIKDYYHRGELNLEEFKKLQWGINVIYILYNRLIDIGNSPLMKGYLKLRGHKLKSGSIFVDFLDNVLYIHESIREKRFKNLQEKLNMLSGKDVSVKCLCCKRTGSYKGEGMVIKDSHDHKDLLNPIGRWICSEKCYNEMYSAS